VVVGVLLIHKDAIKHMEQLCKMRMTEDISNKQ
jgi:hypothetical protein